MFKETFIRDHQIWLGLPPSKCVNIIACCTLIREVAAPMLSHVS